MTRDALLELAKRIDKAPVISVIEPCYEGQAFPASANPLSEVEKRALTNALRVAARASS